MVSRQEGKVAWVRVVVVVAHRVVESGLVDFCRQDPHRMC